MASTDPRTATEAQWEDLANRVKEKAKITMTTTDPGEGSALAADNYIGVYGGDPIIMDYSTSEMNTGTKWIDGSAIYKKTISCGPLPNAATKNIPHGISNLGNIIKFEGFCYRSNYWLPLPEASNGVWAIEVTADNTNLQVITFEDRSDFGTAYVTLYYTKSS